MLNFLTVPKLLHTQGIAQKIYHQRSPVSNIFETVDDQNNSVLSQISKWFKSYHIHKELHKCQGH